MEDITFLLTKIVFYYIILIQIALLHGIPGDLTLEKEEKKGKAQHVLLSMHTQLPEVDKHSTAPLRQ